MPIPSYMREVARFNSETGVWTPGVPRKSTRREIAAGLLRGFLECVAWALFGLVTFALVVLMFTAPARGQTTLEQAAPLPVASFFQPLRNFDRLAELGVDTLFGPEVENAAALPHEFLDQQRIEWVRVAVKRFKVVLKRPTAAELALAGDACVGVLLDVDEPNGKGKTAADLADNARQLRELAPGRRIFLSLAGDKVTSANFAKPAELKLYTDFAQLVGDNGVFTVNNYSANRNATRYPMTWTGDCVQKLMAATGREVWPWVECNDQQLAKPTSKSDGVNLDVNRSPTPAEIRAQVVDAIKKGAKGVGWFTTCDSGKYGWPASYLPLVDRNNQSMAPQYAAVQQITLELRGARPPPATQPSTQPTTQPATQPTTQPSADVARLEAKLDAKAAELDAKLQQLDARLQRIRDAFADPVPAATQPATQPAAATKPVWNTVLRADEPAAAAAMRQATWGHISRYADRPNPRPAGETGPYHVHPDNLRQFARLCRDGGTIDGMVITAGAPVILDWETWYDPATAPRGEGRGMTQEQAITLFASFVRAFKEEAPGIPVSVYGWTGFLYGPERMETWADGIPPAELEKVLASEPAARVLTDTLDFLNPSCYLAAPGYEDRDLAAYRAILRLMLGRSHVKPINPMVGDHFEWNERLEHVNVDVTRGSMDRLAAALLPEVDGFMVWHDRRWPVVESVVLPSLAAAQAAAAGGSQPK